MFAKKEYFKKYYLKNKNKLKNNSKKNRLKNKDKNKEYFKKYYLDNRNKIIKNVSKWTSKNKEKVKNYHKSYNKEYSVNNKEKIKKYKKEYFAINRDKRKEYRLKNKNKISEYMKNYGVENKNTLKSYRKKYWPVYHKKRFKTDAVYKLKVTVRARFIKYLWKNKIAKNNRTFDLVGCTPKELKKHIEKQFLPGMSWENYNFETWHIDHIKPISLAKTMDDIIRLKLMHYTNLQPLWAKDNILKSNKYDEKI